ncbi:esterase-like activity of phytase family protein [Actinomadura sp. KC06]|uniref:esterase-like activity of phytase family protein n=1 Tax=Actinomadura sp. KC06 TaxID=2530369 RepID=UPI001FB5B20D|nr:esterase-like activity of phytase family protein [Actinomadura sp. KC06]
MNGQRILWRGIAAGAAVLAVTAVPAVADGRPAANAAREAGSAADGTGTERADAQPQRRLRITRFLGERRLPHKMTVEGTTFGGVSGIDRDPRTGTWYLISDDRWRYDPARFYTGRLDIDPSTGAFTGVKITGVETLTRRDGSPYPGYAKPESADPESIRYDPRSGRVLWGNEGDRPDETHPDIPVSDLSVRWAGRDGRHRGDVRLPRNLKQTDTRNGPRRNFGIEGLSFTPHGIAAMVEGPRYEDGEPPTAERGAPARLTLWSRSGQVRAQYAYPLDRLPAKPVPPDGATDTGVSEILAIDGHRFLALERSWIQGVGYRVRLYEFDTRGATDVLGRDGLAQGGPYRPVAKRLVTDLGRGSRPVQNLEAMGWGPRLTSGECTLVVGSDDNFSAEEITHFLAFAVDGCPPGPR